MNMTTIKNTALTIGLAIILSTSATVSTLANTTTPSTASPSVERTKPWDKITGSLGGVPESVRKIEYEGSTFYLHEGVTEKDFWTVIAVGPKPVNMITAPDSGKLYAHPVYILWNADKTTLLVHPIVFTYDFVLDAVAVPTTLSEATTEQVKTTKETSQTLTTFTEEQAYMLSDEYTDAVRTEFYRLVNEHRAAHGLRALEVNLELQVYADIRAAEQRTAFGHTRPDGTAAGSGWYESKNVMNTRYAENATATGRLNSDPINTANVIFSSWKNSSGHNQHMLWNFKSEITMALGLAPELDEKGFVISGAIFATGY